MAKRGPASPLPGQREPHHDRPPTGQTGSPTLAPLPPFGRPPGAYGHRLTHWPPTGPLLAIRGGLPLAKGTEGGAYGQRGHTTHWPPKGA